MGSAPNTIEEFLPKRRSAILDRTSSWELISINLTGHHPPAKDSRARYFLTVVDHFKKWAEACQLPNKEATTVARALAEQVFIRCVMPVQILSDQGNEVDSSIMCETCRLYGVDKVRTTAYKPFTNGAVERFHCTLNSMLGKVMSNCQRDWVERLPYVMAAYRAFWLDATCFFPTSGFFVGSSVPRSIWFWELPMSCLPRRGRILSSAKSGCNVRPA